MKLFEVLRGMGVKIEGEEYAEDGEALLGDGVYDASGLDTLVVIGELNSSAERIVELPTIRAFVEQYGGENIYVGTAYETYDIVFLNGKPTELKEGDFIEGSGFNYGSTNLLDFSRLSKVPTKLLILAQND